MKPLICFLSSTLLLLTFYSGKIKDDGWFFKSDEQPADTVGHAVLKPSDQTVNPCVDRGKAIFEGRCITCHSVFKDLTGPALAGVEERVKDRELLREYIRNPGKVTFSNSYFMCLKMKFGSMMTAYPMLTDKDIDCFLEYVKNEAAMHPDLVVKRPALDTLYIDTLTEKSGKLLAEEDPTTNNEELSAENFVDYIRTNGMYNFRIEAQPDWSYGNQYEGSKLGVRKIKLHLKTDFSNNPVLRMYIFFPAQKLLIIGSVGQDNIFHIEQYEDQIPFGKNAIVFASASIGDKIYYGFTNFTVTQRNQTIPLSIKEGSKEQLSQTFQAMKFGEIRLDIITKKKTTVPNIPCSVNTLQNNQ
ncbi:MAG TPA: cytochrome c [Chitinophagaceae bacterium]|nr:cytochrome c [Chitinophagaceae bacterium]